MQARRTVGRGRRRLAFLCAPLACAGLMLAVPSGASALVSVGSLGPLMLTGSGAPDHVTVTVKIDAKGIPIVQIFDPGGVPDPIPPGCLRVDANTIKCPWDSNSGASATMQAGADEVIWDLPFPATGIFSSPLAISAAGGPAATMTDGGTGNDTIAGIGPNGDLQIGGPGNDTLMGGGGNDTENGGPGDDKLKGAAGGDLLNCGGGDDKGVGAGGNDKAKGCEEGKP